VSPQGSELVVLGGAACLGCILPRLATRCQRRVPGRAWAPIPVMLTPALPIPCRGVPLAGLASVLSDVTKQISSLKQDVSHWTSEADDWRRKWVVAGSAAGTPARSAWGQPGRQPQAGKLPICALAEPHLALGAASARRYEGERCRNARLRRMLSSVRAPGAATDYSSGGLSVARHHSCLPANLRSNFGARTSSVAVPARRLLFAPSAGSTGADSASADPDDDDDRAADGRPAALLRQGSLPHTVDRLMSMVMAYSIVQQAAGALARVPHVCCACCVTPGGLASPSWAAHHPQVQRCTAHSHGCSVPRICAWLRACRQGRPAARGGRAAVLCEPGRRCGRVWRGTGGSSGGVGSHGTRMGVRGVT